MMRSYLKLVAGISVSAILLQVSGAITTESGHLADRAQIHVRDYDAFYDFTYYNKTHVTSGVTVFEPWTYMGCSTTGVLKISLAGPDGDWQRRRVLLDLLFRSPDGWAFNLGDSPTNTGTGGDAGSSVNDAQIAYNHGHIYAYLNQKAGNERAFRISDAFRNRLTLIVGDGHVAWIPDEITESNYFYNPNFFALNNQVDWEGPTNNDIYLGVNKVIQKDNTRTGVGLCAIGIKFLPQR